MTKKLIQGIRIRLQDPFWKNVATLFSGSAIAQALPILVLPVITRLYSKEALGFYFVYAAIGLITQVVVSLQYHLAIVLPKERKEADSLLTINFMLVFVISACMALGIWICFDLITAFIEQKELIHWLYAIPISAFFLGIFNAVSYYCNREKKYNIISIGKVSKAVTFSVLQIGFGIIGYLNSGLIISLIIGQGLSSLIMFLYLLNKTEFHFNFEFNSLKLLALKYKDIPLFNTLINFINTVSNQVPLLLLTRYFGVTAAGDYGLANRTISTPLGLLGQSIGQVFYQEASEINNRREDLKGLVLITYKRLFKIGIIPTLLFVVFAPFIFKVFFGEDYIFSSRIAQLIIPWVFLGFLSQPVSSIFTVLRKQKFMLLVNIIVLGLRIVALYLGFIIYSDILISVLLYVLVGVCFNVFQIIYFLNISKTHTSY